MLKYLYFMVLFAYGISEIIIQLVHKKGKNKNLIDITYYFITVPFFLLLITPCYFIFAKNYIPHTANIILSLSVFLIGVVIRINGYIHLANQFSDKVELKADHTLIKTGLYRCIRHPLYLASILMCVGCFIYLMSYFTFILTVVTIIAIHIRIEKEEKYLKENLKGYPEYCAATKRFIPMVY